MKAKTIKVFKIIGIVAAVALLLPLMLWWFARGRLGKLASVGTWAKDWLEPSRDFDEEVKRVEDAKKEELERIDSERVADMDANPYRD